MRRFKYKKGIGLIEIIVAVFILTVILGALITVNNLYIKSSGANINATKAAYLASEGIEAVKIIRDSGWVNITSIQTGTDYYLYFDGSSNIWSATTTVQNIDSFVRKVRVSNVYRDQSGDIAETGNLDENTRKVEVYLQWPNSRGEMLEKKISTYIANILEE